jgi:ferredoxin
MALIHDFLEAFSPAPDKGLSYIIPYIHKMVDEGEMQLIVSMKKTGDKPLTMDEVSEILHIPSKEMSGLLEKSEFRGLLKSNVVDGIPMFSPTSFHSFLMMFAKNERKWFAFPRYIRKMLSNWRFNVTITDIHLPRAEKMRRGDPVTRLHDEDILLLDEVLDRVEAAHDFAVTDCDCRSITGNCDFPTETCLRFNEDAERIIDQGRGRRLTKEEMKELVLDIDKMGLIHQGIKNWKETGEWSICSCCACCCYPLRGGLHADLKGIWPKSYYIAEHDPEKCSYCGTCMRRCQFGAWEHDGTTVDYREKMVKNVVYDPKKCLGCGLCANTCPTEAVTMKELEQTASTARARIFPELGKIFYD